MRADRYTFKQIFNHLYIFFKKLQYYKFFVFYSFKGMFFNQLKFLNVILKIKTYIYL